MAESYSLKARLSATDSGFTSTLKNALASVKSFGSYVGSGILQGVGQSLFSSMTNGARDLYGEINSSNAAWKTFAGNMGIIGKSTAEIDAVKKELQSFAEQTVYSSSDMASTYAQLAAVGTKNTTQLVKGFGSLAAAAENPQQAMKTLSQQATQMAAKPNVAWQDFKLMLEQTPAGIAAVAKQMGMTASELVKNVQDGTVSTQEFFDALTEVGTNKAFSKMATEYKTVDQAIGGLKETLGNKLTPAFDVLSSVAIKGISGIVDSLGKLDGQAIADKASGWIKKAKPYWDSFKNAVVKVCGVVSGVAKKLAPAFNALRGKIGSSIMDIVNKIGAIDVDSMVSKITTGLAKARPYWDMMVAIIDVIRGAVMAAIPYIVQIAEALTNFLLNNSETISKCIPHILGLVGAFKAFKFIKSVVPGMTAFAKSVASMAAKGISGLANKLFGIAKGTKATGEAASSSSTQMLPAAKAFMMIGAGVLMAAAGFALLAFSAISLANAGGPAIAVMFGLVVALAALLIGTLAFINTLSASAAQMTAAATAMLSLGGAVLMLGLGFALLTQSAIALAAAGCPAIVCLLGIVAAIALLAVGAAALGPALTAGSVGFIAFGAAILMVGVGAILAATSLLILSNCLPTLVTYGLQASVSILALGGALLVFGAGALVAGAGAVVLAAGLLALSVALAVAAVAFLALSVGALLSASSLAIMSAALPVLAACGAQAAASLAMVSAALLLFTATATLAGVAATVLGVGLLVLTVTLLSTTVSIATFGVAMLVASAGVLVMAAALKVTQSSMSSIAKNATKAKKALDSMKDSVSIVESGLKGLANLAESAFAAGACISQGFANGMLSCLATVRSAATKLAAEADKAVRAKAKIHSPSKVSQGLGSYFGEGFAEGIADMAKDVWKAAESLVAVPAIAMPDFATAYSGELSSDYNYANRVEYTIVVPLNLDKKEVGKAIASTVQDEQDKAQKRTSRKYGLA